MNLSLGEIHDLLPKVKQSPKLVAQLLRRNPNPPVPRQLILVKSRLAKQSLKLTEWLPRRLQNHNMISKPLFLTLNILVI